MDSSKDIVEYMGTKRNQLNELDYILIIEWRSWIIIQFPVLKANL